MTPEARIAKLEALLREWQDDAVGACCGCGQWLDTEEAQPDQKPQNGGIALDGACLRCRTRVALLVTLL